MFEGVPTMEDELGWVQVPLMLSRVERHMLKNVPAFRPEFCPNVPMLLYLPELLIMEIK